MDDANNQAIIGMLQFHKRIISINCYRRADPSTIRVLSFMSYSDAASRTCGRDKPGSLHSNRLELSPVKVSRAFNLCRENKPLPFSRMDEVLCHRKKYSEEKEVFRRVRSTDFIA